MHHWMEINRVTKLIETIPQRTSAVIEAKGGPTKY